MKYVMLAATLALPLAASAATGPAPLGPNQGKFGDWTAATYGTGAAKACYAFTMAQHSAPTLAGRGPVMLTVTERQGARDEVTIGSGYTYPKNANVKLTIGNNKIDFYTQDSTAFTTAGATAIKAMRNGDSAQAKSTGPKDATITDDFSLNGFSDALKAIMAACP